MLGSIESTNSWHWAAWGKHPAAKDYFCIGPNAQVVKAFSDWVEKGYNILSSKRSPSTTLHSWRFWARGPKRDALICGVGRDSSDGLGRPYPLLIMGTGPLEGWEDQWDLLPFACEKTWSQIEYLSTKRFIDVKELEDAIGIVRPPYPHWSEFVFQRERFQGASPRGIGDLENKATSLLRKPEFFIRLEDGASNDTFTLTGIWHLLLKSPSGGVPNAVFMGGTPDESYLAVFKRPLQPDDFVRLWSDIGALS